MVITVLLNVAATWATPEEMFFRSFLRGRVEVAALAIYFDPVPKSCRPANEAGEARVKLVMAK
jgi:hypothetical protein